MPPLRVVAYNVHGFRAGARRVAEAVAEHAPDVALLNEVDYLSLRLRRFARRLGMRWVSGLRLPRPIPNAVLARPPWRVIDHRLVRLPRSGRGVPRGALVTVLGRAGIRLTAVAVHLGLSAPERRRHAELLSDLLAGRRPAVIGGDLNEGPDGHAASWLAGRYWDAFAVTGAGQGSTFPATRPRARIDYVLVSEGIRVDRAWVGAGDASDHLPVFADVVVGEDA